MATLLAFLVCVVIAGALLVFGGRWGRTALVVALAAVGVLALLTLLWALNLFSVEQLIEGYVDELVTAFGLSPLLAKAVTAILVLPAVAAIGWTFALNDGRRRLGRAGLAALVVLYFGGLWLATREQKVTRAGEPLQCYVVTESGVLWRDIRYRGIDPETGRPCEPVEARLIPTLARLDGLLRIAKPLEPVDPKGRFFSAIGDPIVWFERTASGDYEFFDAPGFHPATGRRLAAVTEADAESWRRHEAEKAEAARRDEERRQAEAEAARRAAEEVARVERERLQAEAEARARKAEERRVAEDAERARQVELARQAEAAALQAEAERREQERLAHLRSLVIAGTADGAENTLGLAIAPGRPDDPLDQLAADLLPGRLAAAAVAPRRVLPAMLAPGFVAEGFFARAFGGDVTALREADAFRRARHILVGQLSTACGSASIQGITSCRVTLSYKMLGNGGVVDSGQLVEAGPGFSTEKAVERGVELMVERAGARLLLAMGG